MKRAALVWWVIQWLFPDRPMAFIVGDSAMPVLRITIQFNHSRGIANILDYPVPNNAFVAIGSSSRAEDTNA